MEYLVRFISAEGRDGHHSAEDLDSALQFAERVRNTEEATDVQVYRLQPVPIRFKAHYKAEVEQGDAEPAQAEDAPSLPEAPPAAAATGAAPAEEPEPEDEDQLVHTGAAGRRLFTRG